MRARFTKAAQEGTAGADYLERLIAVLDQRGLPQEVLDYMPGSGL